MDMLKDRSIGKPTDSQRRIPSLRAQYDLFVNSSNDGAPHTAILTRKNLQPWNPDVEIVDRFGELHVAKQQTDKEHFWAEGFEMIRREDFHPVWAIEEIRSTRPDVVIVHADISYPGGIPLKGGDYIRAFSEIHTFIVSRDKEGWRIAGHDITKRALE